MKFLVLAFCVSAASAASFPFRPQQVSSAVAQAATYPVAAAKTTYNAAKVVATAPVVAAKAVYNAAQDVYAAGKAYNSGSDGESVVVRSESEVNADDFKYFYETSNGISAQANGFTKNVNNEKVVAVEGSYRYTDPNGEIVQVTYVADENGYRAQGDSLPVGPAIPDAILRALEYTAAHPYKENSKY